jgi:hypothetical protein
VPLRLARVLAPPYRLLYVLHTPRGEGAAGRYQSGDVDAAQLEAFLRRFAGYLAADARFDLWIHSMADGGTIVWDRHDQFFAYGTLDAFEAALGELGFGRADALVLPAHSHHYRASFDDEAQAVLAALEWSWSPLRPEDEQ